MSASSLCQPARADSTHALRTSFARNIGTLAPKYAREARNAKRLSGGVVRTTYAAAAPADRITTFAIVRAVADVTSRYPREPPDGPRELSGPLP
jgi:hypothetical protein